MRVFLRWSALLGMRCNPKVKYSQGLCSVLADDHLLIVHPATVAGICCRLC